MTKPYYQSEQRAVEDFSAFGAEKVPCSGALPDEKLDIVIPMLGMRISNKHTFAKSFSIKLDENDWLKDERQARFMGDKLFRRTEVENKQTGKLEKFITLKQDLFLEILSEVYT